MVTSPDLIRVSSDPVLDPDIVLVEMWPLRSPDEKEFAAINNEDFVANGITYYRADIDVSHPNGSDGDISVSIVMSNITRIPGQIFTSEKDTIVCRIMEVNAAEPDVIKHDTHDLLCVEGGTVNAEVVSGELHSRIDENHPLQQGVRGADFPGLVLSE